ncbi:MAG: T9SS type A sorting domain-containing protein [Bacteroidetes bacterium]|nr:T9SS type A sorting domain-containing protein [Bacteroidota bacterium]
MEKHVPFLLCTALLVVGTATAQHAPHAMARKSRPITHPVHPAQAQRADAFWEDDFSVPSHWTMGNLGGTTGQWAIGTAGPSGPFAEDPIASATAANGFALYDSDTHCDADSAYIQNADPIDLTLHPGATLQFEEYYRNYTGRTHVQVSTNGTDWTTITVNQDVVRNDATDNPTLVSVPMGSLVGGHATVWIRFLYGGDCDYWWMVDDVALVDQPEVDMHSVLAETTMWEYVNTATYDSLPYTVFPVSELRPLGLNMTFTNNGYLAATDVVARISTSDGYDESQTYPSVAPLSPTQFVAPAYTPTNALGAHDIHYSLTSDEPDGLPEDNDATVTIRVTEHEYARDAGALSDAYNNQSGDGDQFIIVNAFHVVQDEVLYAIDAAFPNTSELAQVTAVLLDTDLQPIAETLEHELVDEDLSAGGEANFVHFLFEDPQALSAGTDYFIGVRHFGGPNVLVGASGNSPAGTTLIMSDLDGSDAYQVPHTAMVRMNFNATVGIAENDFNNGIGLGQNYPNPAGTGSTRIDLSLEQAAQVTLDLRDVSGKLVRTLLQGNMAQGLHRVDVDTADLEVGVYFYTLTTGSTVSSKRMTVVH